MADVSDQEIWRPVPDYEHTYQVSSLGRVRSLRRRTTPGGVRKLRLNKHGYIDVNLSQHNRTVTHRVHKLVMLAFVGPRPDGAEIRQPTSSRHGRAVVTAAPAARSTARRC